MAHGLRKSETEEEGLVEGNYGGAECTIVLIETPQKNNVFNRSPGCDTRSAVLFRSQLRAYL